MSKHFLRESKHAMFEAMMQAVPDNERLSADTGNREQYLYELEQILYQYEIQSIQNRVMHCAEQFIVECFAFRDKGHQTMFHMNMGAFCKTYRKAPSQLDTAVLYIISANTYLHVLAPLVTEKPRQKLPAHWHCPDMESYDLFYAIKYIAGDTGGLFCKMDLIEDGVLDDAVLCLVLNAILIRDYGLLPG